MLPTFRVRPKIATVKPGNCGASPQTLSISGIMRACRHAYVPSWAVLVDGECTGYGLPVGLAPDVLSVGGSLGVGESEVVGGVGWPEHGRRVDTVAVPVVVMKRSAGSPKRN